MYYLTVNELHQINHNKVEKCINIEIIYRLMIMCNNDYTIIISSKHIIDYNNHAMGYNIHVIEYNIHVIESILMQ